MRTAKRSNTKKGQHKKNKKFLLSTRGEDRKKPVRLREWYPEPQR